MLANAASNLASANSSGIGVATTGPMPLQTENISNDMALV